MNQKQIETIENYLKSKSFESVNENLFCSNESSLRIWIDDRLHIIDGDVYLLQTDNPIEFIFKFEYEFLKNKISNMMIGLRRVQI